MDESGFAPSLPTTYSWSKKGHRKIIPYEAPKRRRVNVIGAYCGTDFRYHVVSGKLSAEVFVQFLETLAPQPGERPVYVVLDNYSIHKAKRIKPRLLDLARRGLHLFFLPPYSPELNHIEPCWRHIKHERMPQRLFQSQESLHQGVEAALQDFSVSTRRFSKPSTAKIPGLSPDSSPGSFPSFNGVLRPFLPFFRS